MADSAGQQATAQALGGDSTLTDLKDEFGKFKAARAPYEPDWYLNSAFFVGRQWLYWNGAGAAGRLDKPTLPKWRETEVDNRILPVVSSRVARKVKNRPTFVATPFTGAESDMDAAQITEKTMEFDWVYLSLQQKLFQAETFADIVCAGFWKIYWDSSCGESAEVVVDSDGKPIQIKGRILKAEDLGSEGLPAGMAIKKICMGDPAVDVLSPFGFYPDPLATSMDELEKAYEEKVRSPDYVKERYDIELEPDTEAGSGPVESRMFSSQLPGASGSYKGIKVHEFWANPSSTFPSGKRVVWAGDKLLAEEDNPIDTMPYVMFSGIKVPDRFWPTAITTQLRPPQVGLNKVKSQIQENANRIGNPALMKSRQANVHYSGVPGEEVLYDSTVTDAVPQYLSPPEVPQYVREREQRYVDSMTEISGLHEVSNANVPAGITAASAINLLQEADDTRIGPEIQDMEFSLGAAGTKLARIRAKFTTDERLLRIAGDDEQWDIIAFRGTMMGKEPTVECQAGSAMPRSKAAKQAGMLEILQTMMQYGLVPDSRDLRKFFKDYDVGGIDKLFSGLSETEQQIQRENRLLAQGTAVNINAFDEDQEHIDGHEEFQRTARYQQLETADQELFETHVNAHRERIKEQVDMQLAAQMQAKVGQTQAAAGQGAEEHQQDLNLKSHEAALAVAKEHAAPPPPAAPEKVSLRTGKPLHG
jgi:hypothetical protein